MLHIWYNENSFHCFVSLAFFLFTFLNLVGSGGSFLFLLVIANILETFNGFPTSLTLDTCLFSHLIACLYPD